MADPQAQAIRAAYRVERDLYGLESDVVRAMRTELEGVRRATLSLLASAPKDWQMTQAQGILAEVERQLRAWQQVTTTAATGALPGAADLGAQQIAAALRAVGISVTASPIIDMGFVAVAYQTLPDLVGGLTNETIQRLGGVLRQTVLAGQGPFEAMQAIGKLTGPGVFGTALVRGEMIVRTELGRISQLANYTAFEDLNSQYDLGLQRKWSAVIDGRTRESHMAANGQIAGTKPGTEATKDSPAAFLVAGIKCYYPHDPRLPARESVACRCIVVPYSPEWDEDAPARSLDDVLASRDDWDEADLDLIAKAAGLDETQLSRIASHGWGTTTDMIFRRYGIATVRGTRAARVWDDLTNPQTISGTMARTQLLLGIERVRRARPDYLGGQWMHTIEVGKPPFARGSAGAWMDRSGILYLNTATTNPGLHGLAAVMSHEIGHSIMNRLGGPIYMGPGRRGLDGANMNLWGLWRTVRRDLTEKPAARTARVDELRRLIEQKRTTIQDLRGIPLHQWADDVTTAQRMVDARVWAAEDMIRTAQANLERIEKGVARAEKRAQKLGVDKFDQPPTHYGLNDEFEDFAESVMRYLADRAAFAKDCPHRAAFIERYIVGKATP